MSGFGVFIQLDRATDSVHFGKKMKKIGRQLPEMS